MDVFNIELAGLTIEIRSRFEYCRWFSRDYLSDKKAEFSVFVSDERLEKMREHSPDIRDEFLERDAIYSAIASKLPYYGRFALHGACISHKNTAYLFTAASGTGKSTHIRLWRRYVGEDVDILNGDKPIFWVSENDGKVSVRAFGTPWCGKEGWNRRKSANVGAICFLRRGEENKISSVVPGDAIPLMLKQMFHPYEPESTAIMLELFDKMITNVPLYALDCDISEDAVKCSFEALTGEKYKRSAVQPTDEEINRIWRMRT
ncbi:MAG: hypothetical protein LUG52_10375 [Clostridia bacterium]|nr:hypothetical protein [Clostridia bacterium]